VSVVGSPTLTATAAADGTFSLEAPVGRVALRVAASGYWSSIVVVELPAAGLSGVALSVESESGVSATGPLLGRSISSANGIVAVVFENESGAGGESASISAGSDPGFTVSSSGAFVQGNTLLVDAPAVVTFTNVAPGSTGASVAGSPGRSTCSVRPAGNASWPVEAKAITFVHAVCTR
jgi:hypothetical protein